MDRSARSLLSVSALVLAVMLAMNYAVQEAAPLDWWPALALALVAFLAWAMGRYESSQAEVSVAPPAYVPPVHEIPAPPPAPPAVEKAPEPPPAPKAAPVVEKAAPPPPSPVVEKVHEPPPAPKTAPPEPPEPVAKAASAKKAAPKPSAKPDDLTVIEGIGPKMSTALIAAGIETYAKLSASSEDTLRAAVEAAGMRLAPTIGTWAEQAAYAVKGDMDGLKAFQATIKGGRKK